MPGEDLLDDRIAAVNAVVRRPDPAPPTSDVLVEGIDADLPLEAASRGGDPLQTIAGGPSKVNEAVQAAAQPRRRMPNVPRTPATPPRGRGPSRSPRRRCHTSPGARSSPPLPDRRDP